MTIALSRRCLFGAGLGLMMLPTKALATPRRMSVREAHEAAERGDILLLDIRTRAEWKETGVATSAHPVSMHEESFLAKLNALTGGDKSKPVALICAVGGRSRALQHILTGMGYDNITDVSEGMIGGVYGPGWIKSKLPVAPYQP
jgi:rhodanese-related sulfurtransferase